MAAPKGIYEIRSKLNGRCYIGSSGNVYRRWRLHVSQLQKNKHHSIILQRHVKKYGINDLLFSIIEECDGRDLIIREQFYIDKYNPYFNVRKIADSNSGIIRRLETREKIRQANLGKKLSEETKKKMATRMMGNSLTIGRRPENARKIINTLNGKIFYSIKEAATFYNMNRTTLNAMLSGQNPNTTSLKVA